MGIFWLFKSSKIKEHEFFEIEKEEKNTSLGLKIHICGDNSFKEQIISNLFSAKISEKQYHSRAKREFKTNQFYWIARIYKELEISNDILNKIMDEIKKDRDRLAPIITQQVILCFISQNNKNSLSLFDNINEDIYCPFFIIVSESQIEKFKNVDSRKIINIICKNMKIETLNSRIISTLWELDCYYNEKGNKICRYTPDNIFKSLEINLPFYSLNILLTGKSRAGKSTFVNYLFNRLTALESCAKDSVTQYLNEYYLYLDKKNKKEENTAITLIDTPGITPNNINKSKEFLQDLLLNNQNDDKNNNKENINKNKINFDKRIHFILFFFMEGESLEGIDDIFDLLNNCGIPVLFIINKAMDDTDNGKTKDINSTISLLSRKEFSKLIDKKNYIGINLVKTRRIPTFGVEEIFERISTIYNEKNSFKEEIKNKVKDCITEYHLGINSINSIADDNKQKIFDEIKRDLEKNINMFQGLSIINIIENGKKSAIKCKNVINSLNNISNKLENFEYNIPIISFFQAFMVKEIGDIFGYDTKEMNYGIKLYLTQIHNKFEKGNFDIKNNIKEEEVKKINLSMNVIEKQIKTEFEKSNQDFILNLANLFKKLKETYDKEGLDDNMINENLTNEICFSCVKFLEEQLLKTKGLIFYNHYLSICENILSDLKIYSKMSPEDWGKKEMKVIKE